MNARTFWIATVVLALAALGTTLYATEAYCFGCSQMACRSSMECYGQDCVCFSGKCVRFGG